MSELSVRICDGAGKVLAQFKAVATVFQSSGNSGFVAHGEKGPSSFLSFKIGAQEYWMTPIRIGERVPKVKGTKDIYVRQSRQSKQMNQAIELLTALKTVEPTKLAALLGQPAPAPSQAPKVPA